MIHRIVIKITTCMVTFLSTAVHAAELASVTHYNDVTICSPPASVYIEELIAIDEEPLSALVREGDKFIYRFSCLPSFAPAVTVRLHVDEAGDGILLIRRVDDRHRGLDNQSNTRLSTQYELNAPEVSKFESLIKSLDFWNIPLNLDPAPDIDGSTWILEGISHGVYNAVALSSPGDNDFRSAGLLLMNYAGLDACEGFGLLGQHELHKLEFVGFLVSGNPPKPVAIVQTPHGQFVRAVAGHGMGTNFGKIEAITEDFIQTTDVIPDGQGGWMERKNRLYRSDSKAQRNNLGK